MEILKLLEDMTQIYAPSGEETEIREYIEKYAKDCCDEVYTDNMGNLIAHKKGNGKKIMFAAHMDEIGVIVTDIDENGLTHFDRIGRLNLRNLVNLRVRFKNGTEGVIGAKEEAFWDKPSYDKLYIDIGANAADNVSVGDTAVFVGGFTVQQGTVISKTLDNRAGCALLMYAMAEIKEAENDLYFVFTVQEEVGLRGAKTAAFSIEPDIAIAVDVTDTGDLPDVPKMAVTMGKGTAIKVMDRSIICDADVRARLTETAKAHNIPYQLEIMTDGGTDAGAIHLTRAGVKTGGISIPTRYIHSISEMASVSDIENSAKLLTEAAKINW